MASTNSHLREAFLFFNLLFGITGSAILVLAENGLAYEAYIEFDRAIGAASMFLSTLGMYGACREKKWPLVMFTIGTSLLSLALLALTVPVAVIRPKVNAAVSVFVNAPLPLDAADPYSQQVADILQSEFECCGLRRGYQDWGKHIPDSCLCPEQHRNSTKCVEVYLPDRHDNSSGKLVYEEPCVPVVTHHVIGALDILVGAGLGFAVMALTGMVLSLALLCQIRSQQPQELYPV